MNQTMNNVITFDLETIPSQLPWVREYCAKTVSPPKTLKKPETIQAWWDNDYAEALDDAVDKMGFDGGSCHIVSFGVAIGDQPAVSFDVADIRDEADQIAAALKYIDDNTDLFGRVFVGHNIAGFDMRVVRQRLITLGMRLPDAWPFFAKPWDNNPYDTMVQWGGGRDFIKLDRLARAFGIKGKEGMDGSQVYGAWQAGRIAEIGEYCRADVEMTREVYKVMTGRIRPPYLAQGAA